MRWAEKEHARFTFFCISEFTLEKENDLMRERVEVPSFSLGARSAMMIKNKLFHNVALTISGTKQPALCYDYLNFWAEETKRAREEKTLCPGKKRERYKKIRESALLRPSLLRAKFSDDDVKKCSSLFARIWCSKWLKDHLLSRKAERTKIDRTTKRQNTARVKRNFQRTKILIFFSSIFRHKHTETSHDREWR